MALYALNTASTNICHTLTPLSSELHYCFRWKLLLNAPTVRLLLSRHFVLTARMVDAVIGLASPATSWSAERATTHQQLAPASGLGERRGFRSSYIDNRLLECDVMQSGSVFRRLGRWCTSPPIGIVYEDMTASFHTFSK